MCRLTPAIADSGGGRQSFGAISNFACKSPLHTCRAESALPLAEIDHLLFDFACFWCARPNNGASCRSRQANGFNPGGNSLPLWMACILLWINDSRTTGRAALGCPLGVGQDTITGV
jgi:hypothetical protein